MVIAYMPEAQSWYYYVVGADQYMCVGHNSHEAHELHVCERQEAEHQIQDRAFLHESWIPADGPMVLGDQVERVKALLCPQ